MLLNCLARATSLVLFFLLHPFTPPHDRILPNGIDGAVLLLGSHKAPEGAVKRCVELAGGKRAKLVVVAPASARNDPAAIAKIQKEWADRKPTSVVVLNWNDPKLPPTLTEATGV